jgi:UDP-N-acetyl-D-mannosaminuronic acid transferase (WecB/TagA/CpsF family)
MMGQVDGKVAFITGGASGIGEACARSLAREGARVVLSDLDDAAGQAVAADITAHGGIAQFVRQDVTDEAALERIVRAAVPRGGRHVSVLINNACVVHGKGWEELLDMLEQQRVILIDGTPAVGIGRHTEHRHRLDQAAVCGQDRATVRSRCAGCASVLIHAARFSFFSYSNRAGHIL